MAAVDACQRCIIKRQDGNMFHSGKCKKKGCRNQQVRLSYLPSITLRIRK